MKLQDVGKVFKVVVGLLLLVGILAACVGENTSGADANGDQESSEEEGEQEPVSIQLAHVGNDEHQFSIASFKFKEIIEEKSDGSIEVEIYNNGQLGGDGDNVEGVQLGTIDMTTVAPDSYTASVIPEYNVFGIPYLFRDLDHARSVVDGEIGRELLDLGEEHGIIGLGYWEMGFANFTNSVRSIKEPADMEGLKLRVQPAPIWEEFLDRLGALATPMEFTELYGAMEQGVVDGQENPLNTVVSMGFYEVQPYLALTQHTYKAGPVFVNGKVWNSLSEQQQTWMEEAVQESSEYQRQQLDKLEEEQIQLLKDEGVTITEPDLDAFREKTEGIEEEVAEEVPAELVDRIKEFGK